MTDTRVTVLRDTIRYSKRLEIDENIATSGRTCASKQTNRPYDPACLRDKCSTVSTISSRLRRFLQPRRQSEDVQCVPQHTPDSSHRLFPRNGEERALVSCQLSPGCVTVTVSLGASQAPIWKGTLVNYHTKHLTVRANYCTSRKPPCQMFASSPQSVELLYAIVENSCR